jgi:WD40 repeat protein
MTRITLLALLMTGPAAAAPPVTAAAFTPDGEHVLVGSQAGIEVRSWPDLTVTGRLQTELSHVHDLAFAPDGRSVLAAGGSPAASGIVEVRSWPDAKLVRRVADHADLVYRVAWAPDGSRWATASADHTCRVHAADSGKLVVKYEGHSRPVLAVAFLPDGKAVVSAGVDQSLQVWAADTGKPVRTLDNHVGPINDLAVRPGTRADAPPVVVSVGDDRTVRVWQPAVGRLVRFTRLPSKPLAVAWSPAGDRLLVGSADGRLRALDPDTLEVVGEKAGPGGRLFTLAPHPKRGRELLAGGEGLGRLGW